MEKLPAVTSCVFLAVGGVTAQTAHMDERLLPQWLTGIIAVSVFLFLTFVVFLVKKAWGDKHARRTTAVSDDEFTVGNGSAHEAHLETLRHDFFSRIQKENWDSPRSLKEDISAYDTRVTDGFEDKVTAM
ncbi:PDZK1-interacting protein 1 [Aulostomus maculatus]